MNVLPADPAHVNKYLPITEFFNQWLNHPIFFQDFLYCLPFNPYVIQCYNNMLRVTSVQHAWNNLFMYFANIYTVDELTDLIYEALHDLDQADKYLHFLEAHNHYYLWPTGKHFCDPSIIPPSSPPTVKE